MQRFVQHQKLFLLAALTAAVFMHQARAAGPEEAGDGAVHPGASQQILLAAAPEADRHHSNRVAGKRPATGKDKESEGRTARRDALLPLPSNIENGSIVALMCGRTYVGTLNLVGKYNVRVRTEGGCGKASISPGQPVSGWVREHGHIYSAPIRFKPAQVSIGGQPVDLAHFPNRPKIWAKGKTQNPNQLRFALPSADLAGAQLVFRANEWLIEKRPVREYADGSILLAPKVGDAFDLPAEPEFYVEGKLWMLDSPGEWAASGGRLYVWAADGKSPEGRVWASPDASGIDATDSKEVSIENVRVFDSKIGIDGSNSTNLRIRHVEIANSAEDGIFAGGTGLLVEHARISNSVQNGIYGFYGIRNSTVAHSTVTSTGMVGMPKRSKGAIVFEDASGQRITDNKVLNSSYIGIRVHRDAVVADNLIDGACLILTDCGGIYTFAPRKEALNVRIERNTIKNLAQRQAYAVYLDDNANGVTVANNVIENNPGGLEIHNGFDNLITGNVFKSSGYEHILMNETTHTPSLRQNRIVRNVFVSNKGEPTYRLWSLVKQPTAELFASYNDNVYTADASNFAEIAGTGMVNFNAWKKRMRQDERSVLKSAPRGTPAKS